MLQRSLIIFFDVLPDDQGVQALVASSKASAELLCSPGQEGEGSLRVCCYGLLRFLPA
jgi:hypothetical protein